MNDNSNDVTSGLGDREMLEYARNVVEPMLVNGLKPFNGYDRARQTVSECDKADHADVVAFELPGGLNGGIDAAPVYIDVKTVTDRCLTTGNYSVGAACVDFWRDARRNHGMLNSYRTAFQIAENGVRTTKFRIVRTSDLLDFIDARGWMDGSYGIIPAKELFGSCAFVEVDFDVPT